MKSRVFLEHFNDVVFQHLTDKIEAIGSSAHIEALLLCLFDHVTASSEWIAIETCSSGLYLCSIVQLFTTRREQTPVSININVYLGHKKEVGLTNKNRIKSNGKQQIPIEIDVLTVERMRSEFKRKTISYSLGTQGRSPCGSLSKDPANSHTG